VELDATVGASVGLAAVVAHPDARENQNTLVNAMGVALLAVQRTIGTKVT
jgi:hypothetical protein